jgi:uncharacterized protein (DUF1684 family)
MWKKIAFALLLIGIVLYSLPESAQVDKAYNAQVQQARRQKNLQFRTAADSPLLAGEKLGFDSLKYFPPDVNYRITAHLHRLDAALAPPLNLRQSDGSTEVYRQWANVDFTIPGQTALQKLVLLQKAGPAGAQEALFVPFTDATNGHQTYGGGRYLDLPLPADGAAEITLDFNAAYNPYCAYNSAYSCPVPPAENKLTVDIAAGEKAFHD